MSYFLFNIFMVNILLSDWVRVKFVFKELCFFCLYRRILCFIFIVRRDWFRLNVLYREGCG